MTPEQNLWCSVVDRAVEDSLDDPLGVLPEYDCAPRSKPWHSIRDKRRKMNVREWNRINARCCLMSSHMAGVYYHAHGRSIEPLRGLLKVIWEKIDENPKLAEHYRKAFNNNLGDRSDRREWA